MKALSKDLFFSFGIYGLGLLAMLISDLYIARKFEEGFISNYAFIKSAILIISTICLMGYDMLFIRDTSLIKRYLRRFVIQTIIISIISVCIIGFVKDISMEQTVFFFVSVVGLAFLNYISSSSRACYNLWKAQFSINFWKLILLFGLLMNIFSYPTGYFTVAILIGAAISYFLRGYYPRDESRGDKIITLNDANKMGAYFLATNLTLIFAVNGEQFVINLYGDPETSSHLFTYFSIFTPIALSVNGFLGFYFGPKIKRQLDFNLTKYFKFSWRIALFSILITTISVFIGYIYMTKFMNVNFLDVDWKLVIVLGVLCIVRGIYVSTSIGLGIFGSHHSLRKSAIFYWIFTILYIGAIITILIFLESRYVAMGIASASLLNWVGRLAVSNFFTIKELKSLPQHV